MSNSNYTRTHFSIEERDSFLWIVLHKDITSICDAASERGLKNVFFAPRWILARSWQMSYLP